MTGNMQIPTPSPRLPTPNSQPSIPYSLLPQSPPQFLDTPTSTPTPLPPPTIEVVEDETPTPAPELSVGQPPNCPIPGSKIFNPGTGAQVQGVIQITGAAFVDDFDYYKFEFRVPGTPDWNFITLFNNPVPEGVLGTWNTDTVQPGEYEFRLVVVDSIGNFPEPCVIRLIVQ